VIRVSRRGLICGMVGLYVVSLMTLGQWTRPSLPLPGPEAMVVMVGSSNSDFSSIREAVSSAPEGSVIRLAGEIFTEGGIVLDKDLFLIGTGADETIIQASETIETAFERVFFIDADATIVLGGITMRHGNPTTGECPRGGGAIVNYGTLWLDRCILVDSMGQCAGALLNRDGNVSAFDCMFLRNRSIRGLNEAGIRSMGSGGAIKNTKGDMLLDGCTIADNVARRNGGAIKNCCRGTLTMVNCTVSGNSCVSGGIHLNGRAVIDHCTIAFNSAEYSLGAGILVDSESVVRDTIVFGNTMGDIAVEGHGLSAKFINVWIGDGRTEIGAYADDPLLGLLGDHGGPTWTHLLLPGSGAIDAAVPGEGPLIDQRGVARPIGVAPDLGAVEVGETED